MLNYFLLTYIVTLNSEKMTPLIIFISWKLLSSALGFIFFKKVATIFLNFLLSFSNLTKSLHLEFTSNHYFILVVFCFYLILYKLTSICTKCNIFKCLRDSTKKITYLIFPLIFYHLLIVWHPTTWVGILPGFRRSNLLINFTQ